MRVFPRAAGSVAVLVTSVSLLSGATSAAVSTAKPAVAARPSVASYHPVTARTVFGRRAGSQLAGGRIVTTRLGGRGGLPSRGLSAVVLQVTATHDTRPASVRLWRAGSQRPAAPAFAVAATGPVEQVVTVATTSAGRIALALTHGHADVRIDALGYYSAAPGARLVTMPSIRTFAAHVAVGKRVRERVVGRGVPANAAAVVLNLELRHPTHSAWLSVGSAGSRAPTLPSGYAVRGRTADLTTIVPVGRGGRLDIGLGAGSAGVVGNVEGYFVSGRVAGAEGFVAVPDATIFRDSALRVAATEDVTPSARSTVPATGVGAVAVMLHVTRPAGRSTPASAITAYADCAGRPAVQVPKSSSADEFTIVPVGPDGRFTLDNAVGAVGVRVDVVGYFPATAPVTVPCVAITDQHTSRQHVGAIEIFDVQHFARLSDAAGSPSLLSRWVPHGHGFGRMADVKLRELDGHQYLVTISGGGGISVVAYPSLKRVLFQTYRANTAWHGVEMLPDGTILAAAATATGRRGYRNGFVELFYRHGSGWASEFLPFDTCPAPGTRLCDGQLADAHEVLWDPVSQTIWAAGLGVMTWSYQSGTERSAPRTEESTYYDVVFDTTGARPGSAHDIQPVFGDPDLFWVSLGAAGVELFTKQSMSQCTEQGDSSTNHWCPYAEQSRLQAHNVKSVGSRPGDGEVIETWPTGIDGCSSCTSTIHLFSRTGVESHRTIGGATFYRARWLDVDYQ